MMPILMGVNRLLDYLVLIIASIDLEDQHLIREIAFLGKVNGVVRNMEILGIISLVTFGLAFMMVVACGVVIGLKGRKG